MITAQEYPHWDAPGIHGKRFKLGVDLAERTVSRHRHTFGRAGGVLREWGTFVRNYREVLVAMDFFTVPTVV